MAVDEDFAKYAKICCGGSCCCTVLITSIVLAAMSWKSVAQGEYALKFNHWCQCVDETPITEPGLKYVGPLHDLIRYPAVYQMMYFDRFDGYTAVAHEQVKPPILSRTFDGLKVDVKVSFQWKLEPNYLPGIYSILGSAEDLFDDQDRPDDKPSFVEAVVRIARGTLTQVCAEYTAAAFFANQTAVQSSMYEKLQAAMTRPDLNFVIPVQGLQLRSVDLPAEYENSIAETQKEEQDFETATAERATREMQMSTVVLQAEQEQQEKLKAAQANASKIDTENQAWVDQYTIFQVRHAEAYALLLAQFNETSTPYQSLFELMKQKALKEHEADKMTLSM